tara:strand:- start:173 stop:460 length:288 start_codon:yes stop_codon:yes gene_type:complete
MLVENVYKEGDTVSIKITSGEEVIGRLVEETPSHVKLKKPMMVVMSGQGIGLAPYMFTIKSEDIKFNANLVVTTAKTIEDINKKYLEATTGLKLN